MPEEKHTIRWTVESAREEELDEIIDFADEIRGYARKRGKGMKMFVNTIKFLFTFELSRMSSEDRKMVIRGLDDEAKSIRRLYKKEEEDE